MAKKKDKLGKLLLTSGNPNAAIFAGSLAVFGLAFVVAVVSFFTTFYLLIGAGVFALAGGLGAWVSLTGQAPTFEVRAKGVRQVQRGEATAIRWEDMKRVVVQKSLRGSKRSVMRITNLNDGTQEYRGEMVMYEFTFAGGGEKIVFSTGGPNPSVHPRTLLSRLQEFVGDKVTVHEPDQEYYFDDD
jgi:hypothetical protein